MAFLPQELSGPKERLYGDLDQKVSAERTIQTYGGS